ncbi:N,N-dimethylformamidase beta subunit family domain-containing protein [Streptomyces sp. NPDC127110]|uniref:N,N-dimethylformamidase beta subunit family domain-containing protein n=1 Tax=Streptomyces sp. NPDC127110 TaxID=3345362 RepID=UPI00363AD8CC
MDGGTGEAVGARDERAPGGPGAGSRGPDRRRVLVVAAGLAGAWPAGAGPAAAQARGGRTAARAAPAGGGLDVPAENSLPGDPGWRVVRPGAPHAVEGFASRTSVLPGEPFDLYVSTPSASYTVSAYRMGWYGGARARLVWRSAPVPGARQTAAVAEGPTRTVRADWRPSMGVDTTGWPEGCYLLRLDTTDGRAQRFVPLTVRSRTTAGRLVVVNAVATWQAYNRWGGADLYRGGTGKKDSRSLAVSFDRPYAARNGAGQFAFFEAPLVALAERMGLPLAYATGVDLAREAGLLLGATGIVSPGHDEYWSPQQRRHVMRARDRGSNLAVLGANCCYRRVRFEPSPVGPDRTVVCFKEDYEADPGYRAGLPPTNDFRRAPLPQPESELYGMMYDGYPVDAPYVVADPSHWLLKGTGARYGDAFAHLVGVEYDRVDPARPAPAPVEVIARSPVVRNGRRTRAESVYMTLPSGAGVFATGTMRWVEALDATGGAGKANHGMDGRTGAFARTVTENLLRVFSRGPAGLTHRPA